MAREVAPRPATIARLWDDPALAARQRERTPAEARRRDEATLAGAYLNFSERVAVSSWRDDLNS